jgi:hypothetical protein
MNTKMEEDNKIEYIDTNGICLLNAKTVKDFILTYKKLITFEWHINNSDNESRYQKAKKYAAPLVNIFKDTYKWNIKGAGIGSVIIPYIDTLSLMKRLFEDYLEDINDISVYMEVKIPYAYGKRTDFLLSFRNTIIMLEFTNYSSSRCYDSKHSKQRQEILSEKLFQVMQYKILLGNVLPSDIKILPYVLMYESDRDSEGKITEETEFSDSNNKNQLGTLASFIRKCYERDTTYATLELNRFLDR